MSMKPTISVHKILVVESCTFWSENVSAEYQILEIMKSLDAFVTRASENQMRWQVILKNI